jgi:glycerophosphoryl diester phosphodiesterase
MSCLLFDDEVKFYNVAHRGFSAIAPENTIVAFEKGIQAGANMLEIDVMLTADSQVIVFHDYRLGRTTNGTGLVKKKSLHEIRELDAGSWFSREYSDERVPLLDEVLELSRGRVKLNIEIKHRRKNGVNLVVEKCIKSVERNKMSDDVIFSSFNLEVLRYLHYRAPRLCFAPLYRHNLNPTPRSFPLQYNAQGVVLNHLFLNRTTVQQFHNLGKKVFVYTVNGLRRIERMILMGVDGVISDNPAAVASVAKRIFG